MTGNERTSTANEQAARMRATRLSGDLCDPRAKRWGDVPAVRVELAPVPIALQPTRYIRTAWAQRAYGVVRELHARAAHDGQRLHLLLEWTSPTRRIAAGAENPYGDHPVSGPDAFPDAVAALFPTDREAPLQSVGTPDGAVAMWRWAAGVPDTVESLLAHGIATEQPLAASSELSARSAGSEERWSVVLSRPLQGVGEREPSFVPGGSGRIAFAAWCGANQERAGLMALSNAWIDFDLEA